METHTLIITKHFPRPSIVRQVYMALERKIISNSYLCFVCMCAHVREGKCGGCGVSSPHTLGPNVWLKVGAVPPLTKTPLCPRRSALTFNTHTHTHAWSHTLTHTHTHTGKPYTCERDHISCALLSKMLSSLTLYPSVSAYSEAAEEAHTIARWAPHLLISIKGGRRELPWRPPLNLQCTSWPTV